MRRAGLSRSFLAGVGITLLPLLLAEPVGRLAGLCTELFGCTGTLFFAGIPAGILAGFVVARWWDILELIAGMWVGAAGYAVVVTGIRGDADLASAVASIVYQVPLGAGVFIGFLGVPLFVIVGLIRWAARRHAGGGTADRTA